MVGIHPTIHPFRVLRNPMFVGCIASCACISFVGCGSGESRVPVFKATSKLVNDQGTPIANATVILHPVTDNGKSPRPHGRTDESGKFNLTTYDTDDGAPEGAYKVSVEQWFRDDPNNQPTNHLTPVLANPATSGIQVTIARGENELKPIVIR